jgi:hypothetical protein
MPCKSKVGNHANPILLEGRLKQVKSIHPGADASKIYDKRGMAFSVDLQTQAVLTVMSGNTRKPKWQSCWRECVHTRKVVEARLRRSD